MPATELCVIHPGALSAACWARLASHLPAGHAGEGARARDDQPLLGARPGPDGRRARRPAARAARPARAPRVLVGWGVGGVVADALARACRAARRVVVLDGARSRRAPASPTRRELLRSLRDVRRRPPRPRAASTRHAATGSSAIARSRDAAARRRAARRHLRRDGPALLRRARRARPARPPPDRRLRRPPACR